MEKTFFAPKLGEMGQKWPKIGFFEFKEKSGHSLSLYLFYIEIFFCCVPAQILHPKNHVPEI